MPEALKISMANMIALIVYALVAGVAYGAIQIGQHNLSQRVTTVEIDVKENRSKIHQIEVSTEADRVRDEYMAAGMRRIENWIKEIDETREEI